MTGEYFIIPFTGQRVYDGTIVIITRLPSIRFIAHDGYFEYNGIAQQGWYLTDAADGSIMPLFKDDLVGMVVEGHPCPPHPPHPPGPHPPGPHPPHPPGPCPPHPPGPYPPEDIARAMITVDSLEDRDRLDSQWLIDGKVVRVNNSSGELRYYQWNASTLSWDNFELGPGFYNKEQADEAIKVVTDDLVQSLDYFNDGTILVTKRDGDVVRIPLEGVVHDPSYDSVSGTLTLPVFGKESIKVVKEFVDSAEFVKGEPGTAQADGTLVITLKQGDDSRTIEADLAPVAPRWETYE